MNNWLMYALTQMIFEIGLVEEEQQINCTLYTWSLRREFWSKPTLMGISPENKTKLMTLILIKHPNINYFYKFKPTCLGTHWIPAQWVQKTLCCWNTLILMRSRTQWNKKFQSQEVNYDSETRNSQMKKKEHHCYVDKWARSINKARSHHKARMG